MMLTFSVPYDVNGTPGVLTVKLTRSDDTLTVELEVSGQTTVITLQTYQFVAALEAIGGLLGK